MHEQKNNISLDLNKCMRMNHQRKSIIKVLVKINIKEFNSTDDV